MMMRTGLLFTLLIILLLSASSQTHAQADGCPCLSQAEVTSTLGSDFVSGSCLIYRDENNINHCYPLSYGSSCAAHDENLAPYCNKQGFPGNPPFCPDSFCYVDPLNCNLPTYPSAYFDGALSYSYATCGSSNNFLDAFTGGQAIDFAQLVNTVERSVVLSKVNVETSLQTIVDYVQVADASNVTSDCAVQDALNCLECEANTCWNGQTVNLVQGVVVQHSSDQDGVDTLQCQATNILRDYEKIASSNYPEEASPIAYMYYGDQSTGGLVQWPGMQYPSSVYDARFRPWYAMGTSGQRSTIICVDVSGSMSENGRISLARDAVAAVLATNTWVDYVGIILFNGDVEDEYPPALATEAELEAMVAWANERIIAGGFTNFEKPLTRAFEMLAPLKDTSCSRAILFLSDGDGSYDSTLLGNQLSLSANEGINIFSYALGSGADETKLLDMTCQSAGIFYEVADQGNLREKMALYYQYYSATQSTCAVKWIQYTDFNTKVDLLSACTAVYDYGVSDSTRRKLAGVNCLDMNTFVTIDQLKSCSGYDDFFAAIKAEASSCDSSTSTLTECQIQKLRLESTGNSAVCSSGPDPNTCTDIPAVPSGSDCTGLTSSRFPDIALDSCSATLGTGLCGANLGASTPVDPALIGGIVGGVVGALLLLFAGVLFVKRKNNSNTTVSKPPAADAQSTPSGAAVPAAAGGTADVEDIPVALEVVDMEEGPGVKNKG